MGANATNKKITILAERAFVIRSVTDVSVRFYEARRIWNASPVHATIFTTRLAAEHVVYDLQHSAEAIRLPDEEFDVVSLYDAILMYGKPIDVRWKPQA